MDNQNNNSSNPSSSSSPTSSNSRENEQQQLKPINELLSPTTPLQEDNKDDSTPEIDQQQQQVAEAVANATASSSPSSSSPPPEPPKINADHATIERILANPTPALSQALSESIIKAATELLLQQPPRLHNVNPASRSPPPPLPPRPRIIIRRSKSNTATSPLRIAGGSSHVIKKRAPGTCLRQRHLRQQPYVSKPADLLLMPPPRGGSSSSGESSLPKQKDPVESPRPQQPDEAAKGDNQENK